MARACKASITEVSAVRMNLTEIVQAVGDISQGFIAQGTITETCTSESVAPVLPDHWATESNDSWLTESGDLWLLEA